MGQASSIDTVAALKKLGFEPDASASSMSFDSEPLSYDFGNLTLTASRTLNRYFVEIFSISGVYSTRRTIAEVEIQLPLRVSSIEQCAAFIAWGINNQLSEDFVPLVTTHWLDEGKNNFDTLPWVIEQKLYQERPQCLVDRDWLKLAIRDLRLLLPKLAESDILSFTFRDEIFSIRSSLKLIALPAAGNNWKSKYEITARNFQNFPKRLNRNKIEVSIWENHLYLAGWRYPIDKTCSA